MELLLLFWILQLQFQGGKLLQAMILSKSPSPRQLKSFALCLSDHLMPALFHIKSLMNYQQESSYHHQSFQSIINQQSLPTYLLKTFCIHWDRIFFNILTPTRVYIPSHLLFNALIMTFTTSFKAYPMFIVSLNILLTPWVTLFLTTILVLLLVLPRSSITAWTMSNSAFLSKYLDGQWSDWH